MRKIKSIAIAAMAVASFVVNADYLYWQIGEATFTTPSGADANFDFATVRNGKDATPTDKVDGDGSEYYTLYTINNGQSAATTQFQFYSDSANPNSTEGGPQFFGDFGSTVSMFLFELWDADGNLVGYSEKTRQQIGYAISPSGGFSGESIAYRPFVLQGVVPEPTSGLLILLGIAGLSLKRKRIA